MKRIRIAVAVSVVVLGLGLSLGARAMPISELQSSCAGGGGDWYSWVWFEELEDGTLDGFTVSVCITPAGGYDSIRAWFEDELQETCIHASNGGGTTCKTPWWDEEIRKPAPTPTPNFQIDDPRVGSTSGSYQEPPPPSPTPRPGTTTTGTTSGTASR